jgi:ABC-type multidrug transport system ATPase subunit
LSVTASGLGKSFGDNRAVDGASFSVNKGELYGIIGPDGAGKTTLFRMLTTLLVPDEGTASVEGFDVVKQYKPIRTLVGYMPGRFSLYHDLSVEENLKFYATVFGTKIEENYDLIKEIYSQIEPFKKRLAGRLSGGMKQKLALSCALIHHPAVLFLDEPTTGVDAVSRKEFWEMLKALQERGITILVSTAYMDEAAQCDRVALMQEGRFLVVDTPENIIDQYDKSIFAVSSDMIYQLLSDTRDYSIVEEAFPFGDSIHFTTSILEPDFEEFEQFLVDRGHTGISMKKIKPGIEDCFMNLMKQ